jgi:hypothetical protein
MGTCTGPDGVGGRAFCRRGRRGAASASLAHRPSTIATSTAYRISHSCHRRRRARLSGRPMVHGADTAAPGVLLQGVGVAGVAGVSSVAGGGLGVAP